MQTLHGYSLDETQWIAKGGGGQCNVAIKGGKEYFIKRLTKPKYPESDKFSGAFRQQKIEECDTWLKRRKDIMKALPGNGTGTLIKPIEYFRDGPCFYEISNMVDVTSIPYDQIWKESKIDKARIMLTVAMSLADVHKVRVVHGDLDPQNILISRAAGGNLITKLIDFTDAFFAQDPPDVIMSKDFWWSPEVALYSKASEQKPNPYREYITCKADVFSLGIVFHQYCSKGGKAPICTKPQPWQEFQIGKKPVIDPEIEPEFRDLIASMLEVEPDDRPSMEDVHKTLLTILRPTSGLGGTESQKTEIGIRRKSEENVQNEKNDDALRKAELDKKRNRDSDNTGIAAGSGKSSNGSHVTSAILLNPRKVKVCFSDGKEQIMDLKLAIRQGYDISLRKHQEI